MKTTPLRDTHAAAGGTLVDFAGWEMPVRYGSIVEEHKQVRTQAGLFDLCHMGRFFVTGPDREAFVDNLVTNSIKKMVPNQIKYGLVTNEAGNILDDVLVYKDGDEAIQIVVNAGNTPKIWDWFQSHQDGFDITLEDKTQSIAMLAMQGPLSEKLSQPFTDANLSELKYYYLTRGTFCGLPAMISRTGYTGEDGFEYYFEAAKAPEVWAQLLEKSGADLAPIGLGARDTLRLEAGMPLYGHEIDETTNPYEANLGWAVKLKAGNYIGRDALAKIKASGALHKKVVGFELADRRVPHQGYPVLAEGKPIGQVASGTASPTVGKNIGTAHVPPGFDAPGTALEIEIRGKTYGATVVPLPFYKREK